MTARAPARDAMAVLCEPLTVAQIAEQPVSFVFTVDLPCTPAQLFGVFEDPTSWPKWVPGIGEVIWTSARPYGVGTTRTVVFWGGTEVYEEFVAWDAPREMSFTFTGTSEAIWHAFGEHYLVDETENGCRLTWTVGYAPRDGFARAHPVIRPVMRLVLGSYMRLLKRYVRRNVR